jgi:MORN repeat variant
MQKRPFYLFALILCFIVSSCDYLNFDNSPSNENNNRCNGVVKHYRDDGSLLSTISYKDSLKNGEAKNFYKSGKLQSLLNYKDDKKEGETRVYYENGKLHSITPYVKGRKHGIKKRYYEDGKLNAEIPYINDEVVPGLKEYSKTGKMKTKPVKIVFELKDETAFKDKFVLQMRLSDGSKAAKFSQAFLNKKGEVLGLSYIESKKGVGHIDYILRPGAQVMKKVEIVAERKTYFGNPQVIRGTYNLAIRNKKSFQ